jgi:Plasmid pRiA4b ORF-3-like protein
MWGFYEMVEKFQNPHHPDHLHTREWLIKIGVDPEFDPNKFDLNAVNAALRLL